VYPDLSALTLALSQAGRGNKSLAPFSQLGRRVGDEGHPSMLHNWDASIRTGLPNITRPGFFQNFIIQFFGLAESSYIFYVNPRKGLKHLDLHLFSPERGSNEAKGLSRLLPSINQRHIKLNNPLLERELYVVLKAEVGILTTV
jgi:hypothetical protein